jgi:hypothetical protein
MYDFLFHDKSIGAWLAVYHMVHGFLVPLPCFGRVDSPFAELVVVRVLDATFLIDRGPHAREPFVSLLQYWLRSRNTCHCQATSVGCRPCVEPVTTRADRLPSDVTTVAVKQGPQLCVTNHPFSQPKGNTIVSDLAAHGIPRAASWCNLDTVLAAARNIVISPATTSVKTRGM